MSPGIVDQLKSWAYPGPGSHSYVEHGLHCRKNLGARTIWSAVGYITMNQKVSRSVIASKEARSEENSRMGDAIICRLRPKDTFYERRNNDKGLSVPSEERRWIRNKDVDEIPVNSVK